MKLSPRSLTVFALIALVFLGLRFQNYESLDRSVSNFDTQGYIQAGALPFFTSKFFTSGRPATIALLYKLARPPSGYQITNLSSPGDFLSPPLANQPGLGSVTVVQALIACLAWLLLAFVIFRNLRQTRIKILGTLLVLFFALVPQMAEWDYVLMSEPLSLSLFIGLLALSIEISVCLATGPRKLERLDAILLASWFAVAVLWVFARDTNAYMLLVVIGVLLLASIFHRRVKLRLPRRALLLLAGLLAVLFIVNSGTAQASVRWINPFFNNLLEHVLSDPEHLAFFEAHGFPATAEVLALKDSSYTQLKFFQIDYLVDWTKARGSSTYIQFIATHPAWAWQTIFFGSQLSFAENNQPFFIHNEDVTPGWLVYAGNLLHPKDESIFIIILLEFAVLAYLVARKADPRLVGLAACLAVFFVGELTMLAVSILGDASSVVRHTIGSLIPIRLTVWLLPPFILDAAAHKKR